MSDKDDSSEKPFAPTQRKLDEARRKGEVAKSNDLFVTASYAGLIMLAGAVGPALLIAMGGILQTPLARADSLAELTFNGSAQPVFGGLGMGLAPALLPWFVVPLVSVILMVLAQQAFTFAPSKLAFKMSRISITQNAKNKYGRGGLFEFAKSFAKLSIYSVCLGVFLVFRLEDISIAALVEPKLAVSVLFDLIFQFTIVVLLIAAAIGAVDYAFQKAEFTRKNMMSLKEMRDESKESEGDPHLKQERRHRAEKIATNRMLADVPKADVVIVNPTHYAVALKWSRLPGHAPECVAKGTDNIAASIREIAIENGVPIRHDPPTARALFATIEIGQQVDREHFRAVAAAIRFAEKMRRKSR